MLFRKWQVVVVGMALTVFLGGCTEGDIPRIVARHDEGITPYGLQNVSVVAKEEKLEIAETPELPAVELEADILGIFEIPEDAEATGGRMAATSQLVAGKDYEITARVLLSTEAEKILGQELDLLLTCPTVVEKGKKATFAVGVLANGSMLLEKEFAVTATAHDVAVEYLPETYAAERNGAVMLFRTGDVIWNENVEKREQTLDFLTSIDHNLGVYEYTLSCQVRTEMLEEQQAEAAEQAANPIYLQLVGVSQQYADDRDKTSALMALSDCLRGGYFKPELIVCEGTVYLVADVILPDWAREYAEKNGLLVSWYNYDVTGCGLGVSLPAFPDNLGHAEASFENLTLGAPITNPFEGYEGALTPYPVTPLSVWYENVEAVFAMENLAMIEMPTDMVSEPRRGRSCATQLLGGEMIKALPETGHFYIVLGTDLTYNAAEGEG